jgi:hypothetical protein
MMARRQLSGSQARHIANIAEQAKLAGGLSNDAIAHKAGYNEKTVRDVIKGRCLVYTTVKEVCSVLDVDLEQVLIRTGLDVSTEGNAPAHLGGYSKENYLDLIGSYVTVRPTYNDPSRLRCYRTKLDWDMGASCLRFTEADRRDSDCQTGHVYIPRASAFMYLLTLDKGWVRTIIVSQLIGKTSIMRGLILSQYNISGNNFAPICTPIVYIRDQAVAQDGLSDEIVPTDPAYPKFASLLSETVSQDFVKLVIPVAPPQRRGADGSSRPQPELTIASGGEREERSAAHSSGVQHRKPRGERL